MNITCCYYVTESNKSPVKEFIDSLDMSTQGKFFSVKGALEKYGYKLPFPHAKYIGNSIFELRFQGKEGAIRVLYFFFYQDKAIFTNGFIKKSNKTPKNEKYIAIKRRNIYISKNINK